MGGTLGWVVGGCRNLGKEIWCFNQRMFNPNKGPSPFFFMLNPPEAVRMEDPNIFGPFGDPNSRRSLEMGQWLRLDLTGMILQVGLKNTFF